MRWCRGGQTLRRHPEFKELRIQRVAFSAKRAAENIYKEEPKQEVHTYVSPSSLLSSALAAAAASVRSSREPTQAEDYSLQP